MDMVHEECFCLCSTHIRVYFKLVKNLLLYAKWYKDTCNRN